MISNAVLSAVAQVPPNDLPLPIRAIVARHMLPVFSCPSIITTDESVRRRRRHFGENVLPVSVLIDYEGRFVLVHYAKDSHPAGWTVAGGYAERDEPLPTAAAREVKEECGLEIELRFPSGVVASKIGSPTEGELGYYLTVFRGVSLGGTLESEDREEIDEIRLATFDEIEALAAAGHFPSIHPSLDASIIECLRPAARV
jgi:ADP-ribose pyrophosphatase YjhB (NUDIX family)